MTGVQTCALPILSPGDRVEVRPLAAAAIIGRGELVAIRLAPGRVPMVKRVVGLPGDAAEVRDGMLIIGDARIAHPVDARSILAIQLVRHGGRLPPETFIVLGDNRTASLDSGTFGLVVRSQIAGRVEPARSKQSGCDSGDCLR